MRFLSLFAGIGGLDLGLERAGWWCVGQVEVEEWCQNILARHWPDVPKRRDVRLVGADWLAGLGPVDAVVGGFPCQDISKAGKLAGIAGQRSGLWSEFARIVGLVRPRLVLVENVPTLRGHGADRVLGDLEAEGYTCWPLVVGARHVGAPHRRDRVFIIGRMAVSRGDGLEGEQPAGAAARAALRGGTLADADGVTLRDEQQRVPARRSGGVRDEGEAESRAHAGERRGRWPARPGEPQHEWEAPRTLESPLGRSAHGISVRLARQRERRALKALGNAVVPQVVEVLGRAILGAGLCGCARHRAAV